MDLVESPGPEAYCRELESYLCRKNDGHLIRIVGPAFEQVCGWAARGIPLKVACRGVDRYFERYYAKGTRRRPIRIEFCEADVLDVFDEWRRAVGVPALTPVAEGDASADARPHATLAAHLERVVARLVAIRRPGEPLDALVAASVQELDAARASANGLRGQARRALLDRLREIEGALIAAARQHASPRDLEQMAVEADSELAPFRDRMPDSSYAAAKDACINRLVRDRWKLPTIAFD